MRRISHLWLLGLALLATTKAAAEGIPELQKAYQKEFTFLAAQEKALREQIARHGQESEKSEQRARTEIDRLENKVLQLKARADAMEKRVAEAEQRAEASRGNSQLLEATFAQAAASLEEHGRPVRLEAIEDGTERLAELFRSANAAVQELGSVRIEEGTFYLTDGTRVEGELVRVGEIAAYGISERGAGALAPAGGGELKLWREPSAETARALLQGREPELMQLFLFESLTNDYTESEEKGVLETIASGGTIGWVIVALGLLATVMIVLRIVFLRQASSATGNLTDRVIGLVRNGQIDGALDACREQSGATSRVMAATLRNLDRDRDHIEDIVAESVLHESGHLDRFGAFILVLAAVSPLLGLLGTVTGMISTFDVITEFGTGDPKLLSGGISIALVTTELGLVVAIPTLLVGNLLSGWAERIKHEMEQSALRLINIHQSSPA